MHIKISGADAGVVEHYKKLRAGEERDNKKQTAGQEISSTQQPRHHANNRKEV